MNSCAPQCATVHVLTPIPMMYQAIKQILESEEGDDVSLEVTFRYPALNDENEKSSANAKGSSPRAVIIRTLDGDNYLELVQLKERFPDVPVVVFPLETKAIRETVMLRSLGASAVIDPKTRPKDFRNLIIRIINGESIEEPYSVDRYARQYDEPHDEGSISEAQFNELTSREKQVLCLLAKGSSNNEIASQLVMSINTVKSHIKNILGKLKASNRTQAALMAMKFLSSSDDSDYPAETTTVS